MMNHVQKASETCAFSTDVFGFDAVSTIPILFSQRVADRLVVARKIFWDVLLSVCGDIY